MLFCCFGFGCFMVVDVWFVIVLFEIVVTLILCGCLWMCLFWFAHAVCIVVFACCLLFWWIRGVYCVAYLFVLFVYLLDWFVLPWLSLGLLIVLLNLSGIKMITCLLWFVIVIIGFLLLGTDACFCFVCFWLFSLGWVVFIVIVSV